MKKSLFIILSFILVFALSACGNNNQNELVADAIAELKYEWEDIYNSDRLSTDCDGYFEIKNTRIIEIKKTDTELFEDVEYIIEFVLYTDYFGSAPYYSSAGVSDSVVVYKDGTMEVAKSNFFNLYRMKTYSSDYSDIIEEVTDLENKYNCVEYLKTDH